MFRVIALLGVFNLAGLAANDPVREVTSQAMRVGGQLVPAFYKGYIYWVGRDGDDHAVTIYAPDGHPALAFVDQNGPVDGVAIDTDGTIAVAWGSITASGIDFLDSCGTLTKTVQTGRYIAAHLAFAEDHSLWSFGWQRDAADLERADRQDYLTVRKYLPGGKEAGGYLPRSLFPPGLEPGGDSWQASSTISVTRDRVGLWAWSGRDSDHTEWVELDLNGNLLGRWRLDPFHVQTIAFTTDGHVFVESRNPKTPDLSLYALDRESSTWRRVEAPPIGRLEGADGDALVFSNFVKPGPMHLCWYQHP